MNLIKNLKNIKNIKNNEIICVNEKKEKVTNEQTKINKIQADSNEKDADF